MGHLQKPTREVVYKRTAERDLTMAVFEPTARGAGARAGMVLFHGGGWVGGTPEQFYGQAASLAGDGLVAFSVAYRLTGTDGTSPRECVKDAFSAMRWIRSHADEFGLDANRLAAAGGSAGGHLAAATATLTAPWTCEGEDQAIDPKPNALVLFNPVFDNGPGGYGHERVKDDWQSFSPLHNLDAKMPPTLTLTGDEDHLLPTETVLDFQRQMRSLGCQSEAVVFGGAAHGFFNGEPYYSQTLALMREFLSRHLGV